MRTPDRWNLYLGGHNPYGKGSLRSYVEWPQAIEKTYGKYMRMSGWTELFFEPDSSVEKAFLADARALALPLTMRQFGRWDPSRIDRFKHYLCPQPEMQALKLAGPSIDDVDGLFEAQTPCDWPLPETSDGSANGCGIKKRQLRYFVMPGGLNLEVQR
jgi:hypothetical protein